jgi:hypothetical protein
LCSADLDRVVSLSELLGKSSVPQPSSMLDSTLIERFEGHSRRPLKSRGWWARVFVGSVSIPKPALGAGVIVIAIAIALATTVGRYISVSSQASGISSDAAPSTPSPEPLSVENTKPEETSNSRERLVLRTVYRERPRPRQTPLPTHERTRQMLDRASPKRDASMTGAIAENGYFTKVDLAVFRPLEDMKLRIIKKDKNDEK